MGSAIGGIYGSAQAAKTAQSGMDSANRAREQALAQWMGLEAPDVASQQLALQQYGNAGDFQTQNEQALQQGPSAMEGIQTDPRLAQAQMTALGQLSQTGQMGMSPAEAAALAQSNRDAQAMAQAKSNQILDNMARRGMGGSGAELAAQLQNAQSAADRASQQGNQIAQNAQQNALQAMVQSGQLGGQMRGQEFGEKSDTAKAKDYINRFNTENSQQVQHTNVQNANQAALRNLLNQQNLMNQNTQLSNAQQQYNKQLQQQQFNNQMALAGGRSGQYQGIANAVQTNAAGQAGRTADMWAGVGQGIDQGVGAAYNYGNNNNYSGGGGGGDFSTQEQNDWLNSGETGGNDNSEWTDFYE